MIARYDCDCGATYWVPKGWDCWRCVCGRTVCAAIAETAECYPGYVQPRKDPFMPFGSNCEFPDFAACVNAMTGKVVNPEGYCATLQRETEDACKTVPHPAPPTSHPAPVPVTETPDVSIPFAPLDGDEEP